ncbi:MAG TPA: hypothetical protein GXZ26_06015 [Firmicutes bacterium]|nr:hypothetical protein [Bacillota bacterium]
MAEAGTRKKLLLISNGHGEDLLGATLAERLLGISGLELTAFPLVGKGRAYTALGIPLVIPGREFPSGGFLRNSLKNLLLDLGSGIIGYTRKQVQALRANRNRFDLAVCLGDLYALFLVGTSLRPPVFFLPTAKSDYIRPHWWLEVKLMRRFAAKVFPRDALTAAALAGQGLPAEFAGNLMMDALRFTDPGFPPRKEGEWIVAFLPGSRQEAYINMEDLATVAVAFQGLLARKGERRTAGFWVALSGGLDFAEVARHLEPLGWSVRPLVPGEAENGVAGCLQHKGGGYPGSEGQSGGGTIRMTVVKGRFADILAACDGVVGLAGTANEQAAGLGKPVVTFPGRGPQFTAEFARMQKRLLGEAVALTEREPALVATELYSVLTDDKRRAAVVRAGRERMGEPGGAERITGIIKDYLGV